MFSESSDNSSSTHPIDRYLMRISVSAGRCTFAPFVAVSSSLPTAMQSHLAHNASRTSFPVSENEEAPLWSCYNDYVRSVLRGRTEVRLAIEQNVNGTFEILYLYAVNWFPSRQLRDQKLMRWVSPHSGVCNSAFVCNGLFIYTSSFKWCWKLFGLKRDEEIRLNVSINM